MNAPDPRLNPHLEAALTRIRLSAEQAAARCAEGLGLSALSAGQAKRRDDLLSAQYVFHRQHGLFAQRMMQSLRRQVANEQSDSKPAPLSRSGVTNWGELSLMDDDQVNNIVKADRIGLAIGHNCEWELREVESYLVGIQSGDRNPVRPETIGQALLDGVQAISDDGRIRQTLTDELTRAMAEEMRGCYADIAELLRNRGLRPQDLRVRQTDDPSSRHGGLSGAGGESQFGAMDSAQGGLSSRGNPSGLDTGLGSSFGGPLPRGSFGRVQPQMMDLMRRLAQTPAGFESSYDSMPGAHASGLGAFDPATAGGEAFWARQPAPPNLIHQHRDELRQMAIGRLDHVVIDVVASLFDQILADPKVPPQMARLIARLQLPVLRVALGDETFFSSRKHPVRLFVNRMASLACAFDDFGQDPGKAFLGRVRDLVQTVATGDFDRMDVYTAQLDALEAYIQEQARASLKANDDSGTDVAALVQRKEVDLRLQLRCAQQLQRALGPVPMPMFLRDFLAQVWSQAIVLSSREGSPELALRLRSMGRSLVMSVQPKGSSALRQEVLRELPHLMRHLNEGLDLIRWPESARKEFFGALLPAHSESLKGQPASALETNLLIKQLEPIFAAPPPTEADLAKAGYEPVTPDIDLSQRLTPAEARSLGLVDEAGVDWDGQVDIDLSGNDEPAPLQAVDISIEGLPAADAPPAPSSGAALFGHLELGCAYQMHTDDKWQKVRLSHVSAGRTFFIFTSGSSKHQQTVTMTARMLRKLCEARRLRSYENAQLLERATARARQQLAALTAGR